MAVTFCKIHAFTILVKNIPFHKNFSFVKGDIFILSGYYIEEFVQMLKQEIYYGVVYYSYEELKSKIERFIKYYNKKRIKEKLGWMSSVQYRLHILAT